MHAKSLAEDAGQCLYSLNHLMCVEDLVSLSARDGGGNTRQPAKVSSACARVLAKLTALGKVRASQRGVVHAELRLNRQPAQWRRATVYFLILQADALVAQVLSNGGLCVCACVCICALVYACLCVCRCGQTR